MKNDVENSDGGSSCGCGGGRCCSGPGKWIWILLALGIFGVLIARNTVTNPPAGRTPAPGGQEKAVPRLVDLGATKCIPCKMMAPILEDLKKTYAGKMDVQFIDVWDNPEAGKKYGINVIPTQIFYDAVGKEVFRHEGFFSKADILAKWKALGVELE